MDKVAERMGYHPDNSGSKASLAWDILEKVAYHLVENGQAKEETWGADTELGNILDGSESVDPLEPSYLSKSEFYLFQFII